jgi:hypothetical protein
MEFPTHLHEDGALFSPDRSRRYALWRVWDLSLPAIMVIGLNPSTANETTDDPTIKSIRRIAAHNGFGKLIMTNLFSWVSSDPKVLDDVYRTRMQFATKMFSDQSKLGVFESTLGDVNRAYLNHFRKQASHVWYAWGNFKQARPEIVKEILQSFPGGLCCHQNGNGSPKHPLYCKSNTILQIFNQDK